MTFRFVDIALSYTETAAEEVKRLKLRLPDDLTIYDYKDWLDRQAGLRISEISKEVYVGTPCIVFATLDWYIRPATVLEMTLLRTNPRRKLIIDYSGTFEARADVHRMQNFEIASFDQTDEVDMRSLSKYLKQLGYKPNE